MPSPLICRPGELVELAERVYRGFFGAGLLVASIATGYATLLGALQPRDGRVTGIAVCLVLLAGQLLALYWRGRLYPILRRQPWLVLWPALAVGIGAWATGSHNQQLFYVLAILLGVLGAALPLRIVGLASLVAAAGMAAPHIASGSWTIGVAVAAGLLPPLFWLIMEQFARFMLRLQQAHGRPLHRRSKRVHVWVDRPSRPATAPEAKDAGQQPDPRTDGGVETALYDDGLTARQLEVLFLCAEGLTHDEIGDCLQIGAVQVGRHLKKARRRIPVATNAELVAWAVVRGMIPRDDPSRSLVGDPQN